MSARHFDPAELEGEELDNWYRRTPEQAKRQSEVARGRPLGWYVAEKEAMDAFDDIAEKYPAISIQYEAPR